MNIFSRKQAEDSPLVKELKARVSQLEAYNTKLANAADDYIQTIETFSDKQADFDSNIKQLNAQHGKEIERIKGELEAEKRSVNWRVNKILAKMGVNDFAPEEISLGGNMNARDIYEKWKSLKGYEKGKYFKANESVIKAFNNEQFKQ
jgi:hypothetical protein